LKTLTILIGNIGSGKSTTCKDLVKDGDVIISRDAFRYMIGAGTYIFNPVLEKAIHKSTYKTLDAFMKIGVNVVVDETNMTIKSRKLYLALAKRYGYYKLAMVMPKYEKSYSVERRLKNNHGNNTKEVWETVWERFNLSYKAPTKEEGFDAVVYI
jgi:predicted kinase